MKNVKEKIEDTNNKIEEVAELFYQQKNVEGYEKLETILSSIIQIIDIIYKMEIDQNVREKNTTELMSVLQEALQALEDRDSVLIADILKYDVEEKLELLVDGINC